MSVLSQTSRLVDDVLGELQGLKSQVSAFDSSLEQMGDKLDQVEKP